MTDITMLDLRAGAAYGGRVISDRTADLQRVVVQAHDGDTWLSVHLTSAEQARALADAFAEAAEMLAAAGLEPVAVTS